MKFDACCPISEAEFPAPFKSGLEFNPPVHGTWNIVHIGMQVPESHQIYVCAINCMRGVVLTAAEMGMMDRFSCVVLEEKDILNGLVEEITIKGTIDVLQRMNMLPKAVMLFTVCTHHFLSCDLKRIYQKLEEKFPSVIFYHCFMDPIMQKEGPSPDHKLRIEMARQIPDLSKIIGQVALLGGDFRIEGDLPEILTEAGCALRQLQDCHTYTEYEQLGHAEVFLCTYPNGKMAIERLGKRLNRPALYLPASFSEAEIDSELRQLAESCRIKIFSDKINELKQSAEAELINAAKLIGDTSIAIDGTVHPRPLGLAKLLLEHGMKVRRVYLDAVSLEEKKDFLWLQNNAPDLALCAITRPVMRVKERTNDEHWLAMGQKAAWFCNTSHFVNLVQGGGLWGYSGIRKMAELIETAYKIEQDTEDIVPRKGLGCESCI